jgi:osmotically-inducible protein OsmY
MKTDAQLQQDVMAELKWEPSIHAAQIGVQAQEGVVTLSGEVASYGEKWDAERTALRVAGVQALAVEIKVRLTGTAQRSDTDIARSAENVLEWTTTIPKGCVQLLVESGWVTLRGEVEWQFQRQTAVDRIRYLAGVVGVSDQIVIKPRVTMGAVKAEIEHALERRAVADAKTISIDVKGGAVTLSGTVHSWSERELANHSAWGTPGVRQVFDHMTLAA